jgi:YfiH family protein
MASRPRVWRPMSSAREIRHRLLEERGVPHAFAVPGPSTLPQVIRPHQVHGCVVARVSDGRSDPERADAIVSCSSDRGAPVGIVTADCLPILACSRGGQVAAAIHAGWRGLAEGVIAAGIRAIASAAGDAEDICAVIGPHIGICCYEVDAVVLAPLERRFGAGALDEATVAVRPGHRRLSLARIALAELALLGVPAENRGVVEPGCTYCDSRGFDSYRRDGERAGRMLHHVSPLPDPAR